MSFTQARVWFITGSSQGLGRALLHVVLEKNERVVATLRNPSVLADLQSKHTSEQLIVVPLDVTKPEQITAAFKKAEEHFHRIDFVVNNAGYGINAEFEGTNDGAARAIFETLLWGPLNVTKAALPFFREVNPPSHGGRIFNVSSIAGYAGYPGLALYASAKFALEGLSESIHKEMPPEWNIKCIILEPGGVETNARKNNVHLPMHPAYSKDSPSQEFLEVLNRAPFIGDPFKAARVIFQISGEPNPPLRLPLGSLACKTILNKAKETIQEVDKWTSLSREVNMDQYSPESLENVEAF